MESVLLIHKLFFTGVIHIIYPEKRLQIWVGIVASLLTFVSWMLYKPYVSDFCDSVFLHDLNRCPLALC
jgi:hypothetical protein